MLNFEIDGMLRCKLNKKMLQKEILLEARLGLSFLNNFENDFIDKIELIVGGEIQKNFCSDTVSCFKGYRVEQNPGRVFDL